MLLLSATFLIPFPISLWAFNLSFAAAVYLAALLLWTGGEPWAGVIGFALLNGTMEEVMFRGVYTDCLASLFRNPLAVVLVQALFFGLCHHKGIPRGFAGVGLSFRYGAVMGLLRLRTGGILVPVVAHILTDAAIALIVLNAALVV